MLAGVVVGHERAVEVEQNGALLRFLHPAALWAELKEDKRGRRRIYPRSYRELDITGVMMRPFPITAGPQIFSSKISAFRTTSSTASLKRRERRPTRRRPR